MEQRDLFEASGYRLPYVECSPDGKDGLKAIICVEKKIGKYPTWIIKGRRYEGVFTPEQLAKFSGYTDVEG